MCSKSKTRDSTQFVNEDFISKLRRIRIRNLCKKNGLQDSKDDLIKRINHPQIDCGICEQNYLDGIKFGMNIPTKNAGWRILSKVVS